MKRINILISYNMNMRKTIYAALLAMCCVNATAQEATTEYVFKPHWNLQVQGGVQETLGEVSFGDLLSPNAQLSVGYQFHPVVGARLSFNAWQSKAGTELKINQTTYKWKWNYVAPMVDVTFDLCNLIGGFNPKRVVSVGIFGGVGANIGFGNDEAAEANTAMLNAFKTEKYTPSTDVQFNKYLWDGTKVRFVGRFGANLDFRLSDVISLGLEVSANVLDDHYNSKKAENADWYFNGLLGLKFNLGKSYTTRTIEPHVCPVAPEPKVVEKVVEKIVEKPAPVPVVQPLRRDIFFVIRGTKISEEEMVKVREIAQYLYQNPSAKVSITGYADKNTGNTKINSGLSEKRAKVVADTLMRQFGIEANRITTDAKGDTEQPYDTPEHNRVSICISK